MPIPNIPSYAQMPNNLSELLKIGNNNQKLLNKGLTNLTKVTNLTKKRVTQIDKISKEFNRKARIIRENQKLAKAAEKVTDLLKKGKFKQINPKLGNAIGFALSLASIGLSFMTINHIGKLQETQLRIDGIIQRDLGDAFSRAINNTLTIRKLREEYNNFVKQYKIDKDQLGANIYANLENLVKVRELSEAAKKQANDALYEAREGRKKVEAKVNDLFNGFQQLVGDVANQNAQLSNRTEEARKLGNDALYEARTNNQQLKAEINQKFQAARKLANDALYETRANRQKLEANFGQQLNSLRRNLNLEIQNVERKTAQQVNSIFNSSKGLINNALSQARTAQAEARGLQQQLNQLRGQVNRLNSTISNLNIAPTVNNLIANSPQIKSLLASLKAANVKLDGFEIQVPINTKLAKNNATNIQFVDGRITKLERGVEIKGLNVVNARISGAESAINNSKIEIDKLKTRVKDRENVDRTALGKLDQVLGLLGPIPLLIGKVPQNTVRQMPKPLTFNQVEAAASSAGCKSTRPGGCMNKALSYNANQINRNTNNWGSNLLNGINTGANAGQLALLQKIDGKLGTKIVGGIGGQVVKNFERVNKFAEWLKLDRMLNMLTWVNTTHNAMMLSTNLGSTLFSIVDNIAGLFFKDIDGVDIDTGKAVSTFFDDAAKKIFGVKNWEDTKVKFNRYNRIYQSMQNALNNITSMFNSAYGAFDVIGNRVSRIGNALRWFGVLSDKAFGWMNENNAFSNPIITRITKVTEAADALEQVSSDVLSISDNAKELIKNTKEIKKGFDDLSKEETKKEDKKRSSLKIPEVKSTDVA